MTERLRVMVISDDADDLIQCYAAVSSGDRWAKYGRTVPADAKGVLNTDVLARMAITLHLSRRAGSPSPPASPPPHERPAASDEGGREPAAAPASEAPQLTPEGEWVYTCASCGKRKKWIRRGAMPEKPMAGAKCLECYRKENPR